ncbi:MAG TPA: PAS domain-containing protein [Rhizomicrobium sp.]|jgi:hypothetical protein|nr:PAS domain-containing protein [Rhizomicrobium sp.]
MTPATARAPARSTVEVIGLDALDHATVRMGAAYWRSIKAGRVMPARSELNPRAMMGILRNIVLMRVLDGGADYEYRIAGDAYVQAYGASIKDARLSQVIAASPEFGKMVRDIYEHVRTTAGPFAMRGWVGREIKDARFAYYESCFLPLGEDGATVDHILVVSIYVPKMV